MSQYQDTLQPLDNMATNNQVDNNSDSSSSFNHKTDDTLANIMSDRSGVHQKKENAETSSKIATAFSAPTEQTHDNPTRYDSVKLDNDPNHTDEESSKPSLIDRIADKLGIQSSDQKDKKQDHGSSSSKDTKNQRDNDPNHDEADSPSFMDKIKSKLGITSDDKTDKKDATDGKDENSPDSHDQQQGVIEVGTFPIFPGELISIPTVDADEVPDSPNSTDKAKITDETDKADDYDKKDESSVPSRSSLPAEPQEKEHQAHKKPQVAKKVSFLTSERNHETFDEFPATKEHHHGSHVIQQPRPSDPPDEDLSNIMPVSTPQADAGIINSVNSTDYNTGELVPGHHNQEGQPSLTTHRSDPTNNASGRSVTEVAL